MLVTLLACGAPIDLASTSDPSVVNVRVSDEDVGPVGADQIVLDGAEFEVAPGANVMMCLFGTYTGPSIGLQEVFTLQGQFGHHLQILGTTTPEFDHPDGEVIDCTGAGGEFAMADLEPIGIPNAGSIDGDAAEVRLPLPAGTAVALDSGQRYVLQSHYLNSGSAPIRVRDRLVLTTLQPDEVENWAAPMVFNLSDFRIPAGESLTASFSCTTETDVEMLYVDGHMHEWGTSFQLDRVDGTELTSFYSVPDWDPVYRDAPLVVDAVDDPIAIPAGTTFQTTCSWFNDTDADLVFPYEMCDAVLVVFPLKAAAICDGRSR